MGCDNKVSEDMVFDCADAPKKGLVGGQGVLINWDDIDFSATTVVKETITDLILKAGTTGYKVQWYKQLGSANSAYAKSTEDVDGFLHNFLTRLATSSAANAARSNELKNGRFIIVCETKYQGVDQLEAFKVYGFDSGLSLGEMVNNTNENSGATLYTLSTDEGDVEKYIYMIFKEDSYAVNKAAFDSLFAPV